MRAQMESSFFEILAPREWSVPLVFNSPHSGQHIPQELLRASRLSKQALRQSEDSFVDELFAGCVEFGAPLLHALVSRSFVDLNREPYELDPRMFVEELPRHMNAASPRVLSGLGTIPRIVTEGEQIYRGKLPLHKALERIEKIYKPYHRTLSALLAEAYGQTGMVLLIDCHSMPASAVQPNNQSSGRIDVVLGDRFGSSSDTAFVSSLETALLNVGFSVRRNRPYAGGFITETHGLPRQNRHAIQIEINRQLYMHEGKLEKNAGFDGTQRALTSAMKTFFAAVAEFSEASRQRTAAE
jgi:N-formylglutamate amidohydrolase